MQAYEFEGKTTEEAIETATRELDRSRDQMEIEVLEPGSPGIFGLVGTRKARIRVTLEEEPTEEGPSELLADEQEDGLAIAKDTLETIISLIPMEGVTVSARNTDGTITLNIEGDQSGLLIGRKGKTLDALQFIVNKVVNKALEKRTQVVVDSENYRARRKDHLINMALKMGDKAKKMKKPVATNMLNPHDRRIVHLALRDDDMLETKSRGEGLLKKVVIIAKR
jgi:spoIIIJ-associated protein